MIKIVLFILLIFFSMFIQSLTGFGGPLIAMPIGIMIIGVDLARPVVTIAATITAMIVAVSMYRDINWKKLFKMVVIMLIGVIGGDLLFGAVSAAPLLIFYGAVVFVIGSRRLFNPDSLRLNKAGQWIAIIAAGIMQGLFTSGGSFLVLYAVEHLQDKKEFRATLSAVWFVLNIYLISKYALTGVLTHEVLSLTGLCLVPELIAIWLAAKLTDRLNQNMFLKITYIILTVSGIILIINSII